MLPAAPPPVRGPGGVFRVSARVLGRPVGLVARRGPLAGARGRTGGHPARPRPVSRVPGVRVRGGLGRGSGEGSSRRTPNRRRMGRRRAPCPGCGGAGAEVRQDLVDHRRVGDDRDDPHGPVAAGAGERVDLEEPAQQRRPPAGDLGGHKPRRGHDRHGSATQVLCYGTAVVIQRA